MSKNLLINTNDMSIFEPRRYYQEYEGTFITATDKSEDDIIDTDRFIEVTEIWGNTVQDENNLEDIQSIGELYVNEDGQPILDDLGREQYKIEINNINFNLNKKDEIFTLTPNNYIEIYLDNSMFKPNKKYELIVNVLENTFDNDIVDFTASHVSIFLTGYSIKIPQGFTGEKKALIQTDSDIVYFNNKLNNYSLRYDTSKAKTGYAKIKICISERETLSTNNYIPHQSNKTTILLPCQLQKVGDVYDRLYWDSEKGKYVVEKNTLFHILDENKSWVKSSQGDEPIFRTFSCVNYFENIRGNNSNLFVDKYLSLDIRKNNNSYGSWLSPIEEGVTIHWKHIGLALRGINNVSSLKEFIKNNKIRLIIPLEFPQLIETNITEKIQLSCYSEKTHIFVNSTVDASMKVLMPYKEII